MLGEFFLSGLDSGRVQWEHGPGGGASACSPLVGCEGGA